MSDSLPAPRSPEPAPTPEPTGALAELRAQLQREIRELSFDLLAGWAVAPPPGRLFLTGFLLGASSSVLTGLLLPALPSSAGLGVSLLLFIGLFQLVRLAESRERRHLVSLNPSDERLAATVQAFQSLPRRERTREAIRAALAGTPLQDGEDCMSRGRHILGCPHYPMPG